MEQVVYVDVLVVVNYLITYLLLVAAAKLGGRTIKLSRVICASFLGGLSSLLIFFPYMQTAVSTLVKLVLTVGLVLVAYPYHSVKQLLKDILILFTVSFFTSGLVLLLIITFPSNMLFYRNGIIYVNIPAVTLIVMTTIAYLGVILFNRIFKTKLHTTLKCNISIYFGERKVELSGFCDTGNHVREPFSGLPVIICEYKPIRAILPLGAENLIHGEVCSGLPEDTIRRFRMISCQGIGKETTLPAFAPDLVVIESEQMTAKTKDVYIAVLTTSLGGDYQAIVNPQAFQLKIQG